MRLKCVMCPCDGRKPYVTHISCTLENLQKIVGGCIETVSMPYGIGRQHVVAVVNEEGLLKKLPVNHCFDTIHLVGDVAVLAVDEGAGEFIGLDDMTAKAVLAQVLYAWRMHYKLTPGRFPTE